MVYDLKWTFLKINKGKTDCQVEKLNKISEKVPYKRRCMYGPHTCERMLSLNNDQKQYHLSTSEWLKLKQLTIPPIAEMWNKWNFPLLFAGGKADGVRVFENSMAVFTAKSWLDTFPMSHQLQHLEKCKHIFFIC